jgi:sulfatase-like protein
MRRVLERGAHLAVLWAFAVAQPLFDLLDRHPDFLPARGASDGQVVLFAVAVALVPPLLLLGVEALVGLVSVPLARLLHLGLVTLLVAAVALQALSMAAAVPALLAALALGLGAAVAYARSRSARSLLNVLAPAPLVFVALFLLVSGTARDVLRDAEVHAADVRPGPPVVLVVFDEFPVHSLMNARGMIDRRLFPNFARLAGDATWFRDTASVSQATPFAVPAILDGREPSHDRLPVAADHPRSLFTLLGPRYELHVQEEATALCPPGLCGRDGSPWDDLGLAYLRMVTPDALDDRLPQVPSAWEGGPSLAQSVRAARGAAPESRAHRKRRLMGNLGAGRPGRFRRFVAGIHGGPAPRLHMVHALLPHVPYEYLPSGRSYRIGPHEDIPGLNSRRALGSRFLTDQAYQRHLLQLGAADELLGELLDRLQRIGVYDRALVAVVADHGVSFRVGHPRRYLRRGNVRDIAPVPFLLKRPGQRAGRVSDRPLRTVDVLPTIADVLGIRIPWRVAGRSAFGPTPAAAPRRRIWAKRFHTSYVVDTPSYRADERAVLRRRERLFGRGVLRFGPRPDLIGAPSSAAARLRVRLLDADRYAHVDPSSGFVPAHVLGTVVSGVLGGGHMVAVAVNGRVAATGVTFTLAGTRSEQFSLMVPERVLRSGHNRIDVMLVGARDR